MALLYFSDILEKAGINPKDVKLIRHSLTDKTFKQIKHLNSVMIKTRSMNIHVIKR